MVNYKHLSSLLKGALLLLPFLLFVLLLILLSLCLFRSLSGIERYRLHSVSLIDGAVEHNGIYTGHLRVM